MKKRGYRKKKTKWKRRKKNQNGIEGDLKKLRQDVNLLTRGLKGELGSKKKKEMKVLYKKYIVKKKGLKTVIEELKQRMLAKSAKVKIQEQRTEQFRQSRISDLNQKRIYT